MNIVKHISFLYVGASFEYMPRSGIAMSSGNIMFNFLRNRQTDFQRSHNLINAQFSQSSNRMGGNDKAIVSMHKTINEYKVHTFPSHLATITFQLATFHLPIIVIFTYLRLYFCMFQLYMCPELYSQKGYLMMQNCCV